MGYKGLLKLLEGALRNLKYSTTQLIDFLTHRMPLNHSCWELYHKKSNIVCGYEQIAGTALRQNN
jgi:hypothetical protein